MAALRGLSVFIGKCELFPASASRNLEMAEGKQTHVQHSNLAEHACLYWDLLCGFTSTLSLSLGVAVCGREGEYFSGSQVSLQWVLT